MPEIAQHESRDERDLRSILDKLLEDDVDITAREVARQHPTIKHASTLTRHPSRRLLLDEYQRRQQELRAWLRRSKERSQKALVEDLAKRDIQVQELERKIKILQISYIAMVRVIASLGGMSKLLAFYEDYQALKNELLRMNLLPDSPILHFPSERPSDGD
jgi:hypothetical protein